MELIKYSPDRAKEKISHLHSMFLTHSDNISIRKSNMLPVAKQKKRRRLSPVNLLKSIRKTLSVLAFSRTKVEVNGYL